MSGQDVIELELSTMAHGGEALGHWHGKVVFVQGGVPGEVVRARIVQDGKRWARADLLSVLTASPSRVEPPCPHFPACGGCQWQHIAYETQLHYKRQIVVEQLQHLGLVRDPLVRPVIGMREPWSYRNHAQFAADRSLRLGFQAAYSHAVVPVERCLILHPMLNELRHLMEVDWPDLVRLSLRAGIHTGEKMCIFEAESDEPPALEVDVDVSCVFRLHDGRDIVLIGSEAYHELLGDRRFRISASSFFQVNTEMATAVVDAVRSYLDPQPDDTLLDIFSGVGTIGLSLADQVGRVIGVEEDFSAIADARANAGDMADVTFPGGSAEALLPGLQEQVSKAVIDPPRQGCGPQVIEALRRLAPRRIVYVSCDPATLARDAALLVQSGYALAEVQPVDMFPQTYHIETVSLWQPVVA